MGGLRLFFISQKKGLSILKLIYFDSSLQAIMSTEFKRDWIKIWSQQYFSLIKSVSIMFSSIQQNHFFKYIYWTFQPECGFLKYLLGEPLGKYHQIETIKRLNIYIYIPRTLLC